MRAILLSICSIYLAGRQIVEGQFPQSLTTAFIMIAVVLLQPAPKRAFGRPGEVLVYGCLAIALAIVVAAAISR